MRHLCLFFDGLSRDERMVSEVDLHPDERNWLPETTVATIRHHLESNAYTFADLHALRMCPGRYYSMPYHWLWILHRYMNHYAK